MENIFSKRGLVFLALFAALAFVGLQTNIFALKGVTGKSFTLFEFFAPIAGGFLGLAGVAVVGVAKLAGITIIGAKSLADYAYLSTGMFAAYYFWKSGSRGFDDRLGIILPVLAMLAFWLHPVGQQAWFYALWWLIPIGCKFLPDWAIFRALGATFTAHAVGSVIFLYTLPTVPALWIGLIPVVAVERLSFALGITASYVFFVNVLNAVDKAWDIGKYVNVEKRYVLQLSKHEE